MNPVHTCCERTACIKAYYLSWNYYIRLLLPITLNLIRLQVPQRRVVAVTMSVNSETLVAETARMRYVYVVAGKSPVSMKRPVEAST